MPMVPDHDVQTSPNAKRTCGASKPDRGADRDVTGARCDLTSYFPRESERARTCTASAVRLSVSSDGSSMRGRCFRFPCDALSTTGRVELHGAGKQVFRFGLADGESGSAATGPAAATMQKSAWDGGCC